MNHSFSRVEAARPPRSIFNRSRGYKTTFDGGKLVPFFAEEIIPGDSLNLRMSAFARLATPIHPVMDNMFLETFFFFVPNRLLWSNFKKFMGEQVDPGDSTDFTIPVIDKTAAPVVGTGFPVGCICDYMGIPTEIPGLEVNNLHGRAYNLIYNEWFRDENLQDSVQVDIDDGPDDPTDYTILNRGKRHDYFTSCLPWPQKGDSVELPLGTSASVISTDTSVQFKTNVDATSRSFTSGTSATTAGLSGYGAASGSIRFGDNTGLETDLSTATSATINELRNAFQVQRMYERDARGGTRYTELVRSHFGVTSDDARLQRPEYLGGGSSRINIHPVPQSSSTDATSDQGNLAAFGTASTNGHGFSKSFTEHGVIIGIVNARADLTYQQGLNKMWTRQTRHDYYFPSFAHLGEQAVLNKEIYAQGSANPTADEAVFGYQERFAEMRYGNSLITGQFRSTYATSLDLWHLSEEFSALPVLNSSFITSDPPLDRVIATPTEPHFLFDAYLDIKHARVMPTYGTPGLIDHF